MSRESTWVTLLGSLFLSVTGCQGPGPPAPTSTPACEHASLVGDLAAPVGSDLRTWFGRIERWGLATTRQAWLALARRALPHTPPELGLTGFARAVEDWVLHPDPETERAARRAHHEVNERLLEPENMAVLTEAFAQDGEGVVEEAYFAALQALWATLPPEPGVLVGEGVDPLGSALELEAALQRRDRRRGDPTLEAGEELRRAIARELLHGRGAACHPVGPCGPTVAAGSPRPRS